MMLALSPQFHARNILRISHEMYAQAEQGNWTEFSELEAKRQEIITRLFSHPHIDAALEELASTLNQIMAIDNKSMLLGEREKQRLAGEMSWLEQHRQAAQVYQFVSMNDA